MKRWLILLCVLLVSCSDEKQPVERLRLNFRYNLQSWPDSTYIASLDSVLAAEPVKKDTSSPETEITINTQKMPVFVLPSHRKFLPASDQEPSGKESRAQPAKSGQTSAARNQEEEHFADTFASAVSRWQSDPSNKTLYKTVKAETKEDLFALLVRTYGKGAAHLPRFYTLSALQSVNPGVALEHLKSGDSVRVPRW